MIIDSIIRLIIELIIDGYRVWGVEYTKSNPERVVMEQWKKDLGK